MFQQVFLKALLTFFLSGMSYCLMQAQDSARITENKVLISHGNKGFEFRSRDDRFLLQLQSRLQFRYATPTDQDPRTFDDFNAPASHVFKINRARLKVGGHAYKTWLKYYWEYDIAGGNLLDFRIMIEKWDYLNFKVGQWKIYYSRERVISSGKQQLVDRSIINRPFTLDRQEGVSVFGRVMEGSFFDFTYHLTVASGTGRSARSNDDDNLMYVGRWQWNLFGRELAMTASDIDYHEQFTGSIAVAGATNISPYTRFSTSGGGQLEGFDAGTAGEYRTDQFLIESAFMFRGFSWQQEYHHKQITDYVNGAQTTILNGNLVQAGYFLHHAMSWFPEPLELAVRYTYFNPNRNLLASRHQEEYSIAANWFFNGHANKLTAEVSMFHSHQSQPELYEGTRFRLQWDISL